MELTRFSTAPEWKPEIFSVPSTTQLQSKVMPANHLFLPPSAAQGPTLWTAGVSSGACGGSPTCPCPNGCWFLFSQSGCKQSDECSHCHYEACCLLADLKRKELRREHSRLRPSKKKRDRINKSSQDDEEYSLERYASDGLSMTTAGWETSHEQGSASSASSGGSLTPPAATPQDKMSLSELQALLAIIQESYSSR